MVADRITYFADVILPLSVPNYYSYRVPHELKDAKLKNPIKISEDWSVREELFLGNDQLIIAEKGVECLPELSKK